MNIHGLYRYVTGKVSITEQPTFMAPAVGAAIAANKSMISILNTSTKVVRVQEVWMWNSQTSAVTGQIATFELRRLTGHSAGTLLTPSSNDSADTLDSGITLRTGATITGESATLLSRALWSTDEYGTGTLDQEGFDKGFQLMFPFYRSSPGLKPITLRQNEGAHVKQVTATVGTFDFLLVFTQEG